MAAELTNIFSGWHLWQVVQINWYFRDWLPQSPAVCLNSVLAWCRYVILAGWALCLSMILVVERESVPEMVVLVVEGESVPEMVVYLNHLMWPLAQEDCIGCWCIPEECLNGRWWEACLVHELHWYYCSLQIVPRYCWWMCVCIYTHTCMHVCMLLPLLLLLLLLLLILLLYDYYYFNRGVVLHPSCVSEKVGINQMCVIQKLYFKSAKSTSERTLNRKW